ncbi:fibrous sheath CABYR-binding protein-like isoform X2 [Pungitius pungitius]|uniref:fibrous sheath CABYR-binding protein-like isoform X2 n=1 Tax=Pungitius pungitius TaxID=134920 RepID=UPI002E16868F
MFCRRAFQRVGPLARRAFKPTSRNAPVRHMAIGVPGGSSNVAYIVLCGGGLTAAVVYAYKTVSGDGERHEDRLAPMAVVEKAPEAAAPAAEPAAVEEAAAPPEVLAESVPAPAEPVAEAAAVEAVPEEEEEEAAAVEVVVTEPASTEEAAPAAVEEAAPATMEVAATEETPAEAPAAEAPVAESAESMPGLLTAVKVLTGTPIEIAAASVETSLLKSLDFTVEVVEPEAVEAITEVEAIEATMVNEELKSADAEELVEEGTAASVEAALEEEEEEKLAASEEPITSVLAVVEEGDVESEDQDAHPAAVSEEAVASSDAPPEDAAPAEEATAAADAAPLDDAAPNAETWVEDVAAEAAAVVDTSQLAAASSGSDLEVLSAAQPGATPEAPVQEAKHCVSCHPSIAVEEAPPAALGVQLSGEEDADITEEVKEAESLVEEQKPKVSNWTVKSCSVM